MTSWAGGGAHNQPLAIVQSGPTWSLTASHEVLELLVDPSGNRLVAAPAIAIVENDIQDTDGKVEYLVEVGDPVEGDANAYLIDGVLVSDFITPHYYDPAGSAGARYSFSGKVTRPRQVLADGYLSWYDPATNTIKQVRHFGAPVIVTLGTGKPGASLTGGQSLRGFVDGQTVTPSTLSSLNRSSGAMQARDARVNYLAASAPQRGSLYSACTKAIMDRGSTTATQAQGAAAADAHGALAANIDTFAKPGVLAVRSGLQMGATGLTGARAIIVTADPAQLAAVRAALPPAVGGVSVDIRPANPLQQMRSQQPVQYLALADARQEARQPDFDDEVFFDGQGNRTQVPRIDAFAARTQKQQLDYTPPAGASLDAVTDDVTLVLHASPDAGWDQLSAFLAGVERSLVVGMYDFTSAHILSALEDAMAGKALTLTLDHPAPNPSRDQTDEQTIQELATKLDHVQSAWALTNSDKLATAWIYPNAYHIKVAVRDDGVFWLSSGNWNNSNQPEIDLSDPAAAGKIATGHDRDWHVIATSPALADTFRAFLENDFAVARDHNVPPANAALAAQQAAEPEVEMPVAALAAGRRPRQFFAPKTIRGRIRVQPLLTPDNYSQHVQPLIEGAAKTFYMQTQYIHPSGRPGDEAHDALIAAVAALITAGVDVRLITSEFQTDDWVEKVVNAGITRTALRRQPKVHNKGIVVDGRIAMVSSQNWSADGTQRNRDAGLIIESPDAASYFGAIFLHDWDNLASPV